MNLSSIKKSFPLALIFLLLSFFSTVPGYAQETPLEVGAKLPAIDQVLVDVSMEELTLAEVASDNGLLIVFICNTCPWVRKWESRFNGLAERAESLGIGTIFLNPNEALRDEAESFEAMKETANNGGYTFYYAADTNHLVADALGATRTPEVYLFDADMVLVYRGAIDDNARHEEQVESHYLREAMELMATGDAIVAPVQKAIGCTIKRLKAD